MLRTLLTIARKDATVVSRDKAAVLVLVAMPLALIFILGSALGNLETADFDIPVAIVNQDTGTVGAEFVKGITGTKEITALFDITESTDAEAVRRSVEKGDLTAALIIPAGTTTDVAARTPVTLEVLQDPGSTTSAGIWAGVVRAATSYASAQLVIGQTMADAMATTPGAPPAVGAPPSGIAAPDLTAVEVREVEAAVEKRVPMMSYYAAAMTTMFLLFGSMFGAFTFVAERRQQTLARMLVAPTTKVAIVGGKGLGILFVGLLQLAVLLLGTRFIFGVDWGEHALAAVLLGVAEVFAATGLMMTLAALAKTERAIGGIGPGIFMLFAASGGAMAPVEAMPAWLHPVQYVSPLYWTLQGMLEVMRGATLAEVAWRIGIVVAIGVVLYAFGVWRLRYE